MGQISVKTYAANGSLLNDNQHVKVNGTIAPEIFKAPTDFLEAK
ncbi:MAG: hypothetical protein ACK519_10475 [Sphingomonadaceae bacterium]